MKTLLASLAVLVLASSVQAAPRHSNKPLFDYFAEQALKSN